VICETAEPKVVGWCLEVHDLWVAKAAAGRDKDRDYCTALAAAGIVERAVCEQRIAQLPPAEQRRAHHIASHAFTPPRH
jgi:hypothetical protein